MAKPPRWIKLPLGLAVAAATVATAFAVNQMRLDRASWPWWIAAVAAAFVGVWLGRIGRGEHGSNEAEAMEGGSADAGNRGALDQRYPTQNRAVAKGRGSIARAGDTFGDDGREAPDSQSPTS